MNKEGPGKIALRDLLAVAEVDGLLLVWPDGDMETFAGGETEEAASLYGSQRVERVTWFNNGGKPSDAMAEIHLREEENQ